MIDRLPTHGIPDSPEGIEHELAAYLAGASPTAALTDGKSMVA
ncbi:hypothetical protein EDF58_1112 [Novosphingobium sp. PhB57]|nr:hypothetical protein [Novosphingobium sp. PhB57]TCU53589.1 hypothetical protein EDF58_1112 [Novosphingobium sp. PhB57]